MAIRAVLFDVGETLIDESRIWGGWADWLGVPRPSFYALLGSLIERGRDHHELFQLLRPGFDLAAEERARAGAGAPNEFDAADLYPDVRPAMARLKEQGYWVGIAGNQPARAAASIRAMGLGVDLILTSAAMGFEKPDVRFFQRAALASGHDTAEIAYVGDRLDNDVLPALASGMKAVFLQRGPWGHIHSLRPEIQRAHLRIASLLDLPAAFNGIDGVPVRR
ncbi:MAG: HAD family hydrolase [Dehalococcoidia bacterium]|nr:HAD family hydrolase [Dehalococcoidia bacterium]